MENNTTQNPEEAVKSTNQVPSNTDTVDATRGDETTPSVTEPTPITPINEPNVGPHIHATWVEGKMKECAEYLAKLAKKNENEGHTLHSQLYQNISNIITGQVEALFIP